jgi:hypothetical protein
MKQIKMMQNFQLNNLPITFQYWPVFKPIIARTDPYKYQVVFAPTKLSIIDNQID